MEDRCGGGGYDDYGERVAKMTLQIFAINRDGERYEIDDLYFFEEQYIHWFTDKGYEGYTFEIVVDNKIVWSNNGKSNRVSIL